MAKRAQHNNWKNHQRQLRYLSIGVVMLPTLRQEAQIILKGKKIKK